MESQLSGGDYASILDDGARQPGRDDAAADGASFDRSFALLRGHPLIGANYLDITSPVRLLAHGSN